MYDSLSLRDIDRVQHIRQIRMPTYIGFEA